MCKQRFQNQRKTANLAMKNNMSPPTAMLKQSGVVYQFTCPLPHSQAVNYIGMTKTTLSRRLTYHGQEGAIFDHFQNVHGSKPTREQLTENTVVTAKAQDRHRLAIIEALHILNNNPSLNKQYDNFANTLKLYKYRNTARKDTTLPNPVPVPQVNTDLSPTHRTLSAG